jgi:hypothetical protein
MPQQPLFSGSCRFVQGAKRPPFGMLLTISRWLAAPDAVRDSRSEHRGAVPTAVELVQEGIAILVDEDLGNDVPVKDI